MFGSAPLDLMASAPHEALKVYIAIAAARRNKNRWVRVQRSALAEQCFDEVARRKFARRTLLNRISTAIRWLENNGWMDVDRGRGRQSGFLLRGLGVQQNETYYPDGASAPLESSTTIERATQPQSSTLLGRPTQESSSTPLERAGVARSGACQFGQSSTPLERALKKDKGLKVQPPSPFREEAEDEDLLQGDPWAEALARQRMRRQSA